jgi:predicted dehydrogenase
VSVQVGVIGVNGIGQAHLFALGPQLAAVCDVDAGRATKAAEDHHVPAFTDARELYGCDGLDAVVIATPPGTHGALVRDALAAGLHVYCEKPIAPTCDEGYALAADARARGLVLQVGFQFRFHKGYSAMRAAVAALGRPRRVDVTATNCFRAQQYFRASGWRATWRVAGGGVLMTQAIHQLDAMIATVGMPTRVTGMVRNARHDAEVEDEAEAELEWADGARGRLVASLTEPAGREHFEIVCEQGALVLSDGYDVRVAHHDDVQRLIDDSPDEFPEPPVEWEPINVPRAKSEWFDMMLDAHRDFLHAIERHASPVVDAEAGTRAVELANAIYLSSCTGEAVELPLPAGAYGPVYEQLAAGHRVLSP